MIRRALLALAFWAPLPLAAQVLDDATCGVISEAVMDLAQDAGRPATLAPDGSIGADESGCFATGLVVRLNSRMDLRIGFLGWSGTGLQDWVAGHGLPLSLNVTLRNAYFATRIPGHKAYEWSTNITQRRFAASGAFNARWDPKVGRLFVDRLELRGAGNGIALSGILGGIPPEPSQARLQMVRLKALDARIDMAGVFEVLVLVPFVAGFMADEPDPASAFARYIALLRRYIAPLPEPQFDGATKAALNGFLSSLPSPTGRLSVTFDAPQDGVATPSVALRSVLRQTTPENLARFLGSTMGASTLRMQWQPAIAAE